MSTPATESGDESRPGFGFRLGVFLRLILDLRRHDFRAGRTFMTMAFADGPLPVRLLKFLGWSLHQMWSEIPDAMQRTRFARPVSRVPCWLADGNPLANHPWASRPGAELAGEAAAVVIGCGMGGSALAWHWAKHAGPDRKMVVLDMEDPASGSGGRNQGVVVMGRYYHMVYKTVGAYLETARRRVSSEDRDKLAHRFAATYCRACYRNADMIEQTIRDEGFDCDYARRGWVQARDADEQDGLAETVAMAVASGFDDWKSITPEEVARRTGMCTGHDAGFSLAAASFHPAKWCWSLLHAALATERVDLFTRTRVLSVDDVGEAYLVHTPRGTIRTPHVVVATESYTPLLYPQFHDRIQPHQTQAAIGEGGPDAMLPHVGISCSRGFFGRLGGRTMIGSDATRVPDDEAGRIQPSRFLTRYVCVEMKRLFGASDLHITHEWSGTVSYTPDEYPIVGVFDGKRQHILGGMAGSGTAVHFNGARCIINRILGRTNEQDDYPPEFFAPTRLLDPANHPWPEPGENP